jgi:hypothetical protein
MELRRSTGAALERPGDHQRRDERNQGSPKDAKSSSTNSSKNDDRVIRNQVLGTSNEERRELNSGSANGRETTTLSNHDWSGASASQLQVVSATTLGIRQRFIRLAGALEFNRRGAGANIRVVPPRQRAESTPDGFVVSILRDTQHNVVVHRASSLACSYY